MKAALILAAVLLALPAQAKPWQCVLYPRTCDAPVVVTAPAPEPEIVPVPRPRPQAAPVAAPAVAKPHHKPDAKPARVKSKFKKAKRKIYTAAELAAMPGLAWPCAAVRLGVAGKTRAQLIAEGRAKGISLNPRQLKETCECGVKAACVKGLWS
jgi:hypothetical protein